MSTFSTRWHICSKSTGMLNFQSELQACNPISPNFGSRFHAYRQVSSCWTETAVCLLFLGLEKESKQGDLTKCTTKRMSYYCRCWLCNKYAGTQTWRLLAAQTPPWVLSTILGIIFQTNSYIQALTSSGTEMVDADLLWLLVASLLCIKRNLRWILSFFQRLLNSVFIFLELGK